MKASMLHVEAALSEYSQILDRACQITMGPPFWMRAEEEYARLVITGDVATLFWPEVESGYYNSCSIERQSAKFPAELLLMSQDELSAWKAEQKRLYEEKESAERKAKAEIQAKFNEANERRTLAALKAKYGG
jgi:hypothetical protein